MNLVRRIRRPWLLFFLGFLFAWACPWDDQLREYLSAHFWLPFSKHPASFEKPHVRRMDAPYAGMAPAAANTPLGRLRVAYQPMSKPYVRDTSSPLDLSVLRQAVATARADPSLTRREKEEVDLIAAKIEIRAASPDDAELLRSAKEKLQAFLRTARTPEFRSEARGWLARVYYLSGDQTAAGKIYLDELNLPGSNLSRETLLNSLDMNYGYDGGPQLLAHLEEYFDTAEHAAFAIQLVTNPHWQRETVRFNQADKGFHDYGRIKELLARHASLLQPNDGASALALLTMRVALRMGDPPAARMIADSVPADAAVRANPDFNWMSASARFLSRDYAATEQPLLALFHSPHAAAGQRAAAAYGLCGVYWKTHNVAEQLRFALWLHAADRRQEYLVIPADLSDLSIYWASSGWDLGMLLEAEAPVGALQSFVERNPDLADIRLVKYSLAVRLTRENRYEEAADIYRSIHAFRRAFRIRRLAALYREANRTDLPAEAAAEAKYKLAEFLDDNPNGIYFNDALWSGLQRYAFQASTDGRLTQEEHQRLIVAERKLKDDQEERWRAYLILREVVRDSGHTGQGRRAAALAIRCLGQISERFERQDEIRQARVELSKWLRRQG